MNITEENDKFELDTDDFEKDFSFTKLKDKVAKVLGLIENEIYGLDVTETLENYQQKRDRLMVIILN